jgi:hypothetical protein
LVPSYETNLQNQVANKLTEQDCQRQHENKFIKFINFIIKKRGVLLIYFILLIKVNPTFFHSVSFSNAERSFIFFVVTIKMVKFPKYNLTNSSFFMKVKSSLLFNSPSKQVAHKS